VFPNRDLIKGLTQYNSTTLPLPQPAGKDRFKPDDGDTICLRNLRLFSSTRMQSIALKYLCIYPQETGEHRKET